MRDKLNQTVDGKDRLAVVADIRHVLKNCFAYNHDDTPEFKIWAFELKTELAQAAAEAASRKTGKDRNGPIESRERKTFFANLLSSVEI